jgi:hypothetical protein
MTFNKIFLGALLCAPFLSQAETEVIDTKIFCNKTEIIVRDLTKIFGESPVLTGKTSDQAKSTMTLWMNPITNSWSIVATNKQTSCIVGVGEELKIIRFNELRTLESLPKDKKGSKINVM